MEINVEIDYHGRNLTVTGEWDGQKFTVEGIANDNGDDITVGVFDDADIADQITTLACQAATENDVERAERIQDEKKGH